MPKKRHPFSANQDRPPSKAAGPDFVRYDGRLGFSAIRPMGM